MRSATIPLAPETDDIVLSSRQGPARSPGSRTPGRWARVMGLIAAVGGVLTIGYVGVTIVPAQLEAGRLLTDTPIAYQGTVYGAAASLLVWSALALAAVITGLVALRRRESTGAALTGVIAGLTAPVLWFAAFLVPVLMMTGLLT